MSFDIFRGIYIYRSFDFRAYPNPRFGLCMAKGGIRVVLIIYLLNKKKKKNNIETILNSIEFPLLDLDRTTPNSVISSTSNDLSNWSRFSRLWPLLLNQNMLLLWQRVQLQGVCSVPIRIVLFGE